MTDIITSLQQVASEIIAMIPNLLAALILLLIGWIVGRILGKYIALFLERIGVGNAIANTSIGMAIEEQYDGGNRGIIRLFELLVRWFIYLIAILAAANVLQLTFLTSLVQSIVAFIPNIAMFLIILIVGFLLIDYFARFVRGIGDVQRISMLGPVVSMLEVFLYFVVVMLALQRLRLDPDHHLHLHHPAGLGNRPRCGGSDRDHRRIRASRPGTRDDGQPARPDQERLKHPPLFLSSGSP